MSDTQKPVGYLLHWPAIGGGTQIIFADTPNAGKAIGCRVQAVYTTPPAAAARIAELERERDALRSELATAMQQRSRAVTVGSDLEQENERLRSELAEARALLDQARVALNLALEHPNIGRAHEYRMAKNAVAAIAAMQGKPG